MKSARAVMIDAARSLSIMLSNARMNRVPPAETLKIHKEHLTQLVKLLEYDNKQLKPFEWED